MNQKNDNRELSKEIWRRAFTSLISGVKMRTVAAKSFLLAFVATLFTIPYFHYYLTVAVSKDDGLSMAQNSWPFLPFSPFLPFLIFQLTILFFLLFLCSMIGLTFSKRYSLPGFGDFKKFLKSIPLLIVAGSVMIALSFIFFDRFYFQISPQSYPVDMIYLVSFPFKSALTDQIIALLGLTTIAVGLLRSKGAGVVLVSALSAFFIIKYNQFVGIDPEFEYLFVSQLLVAFISNLIFGYLYVKHGLYYAMGLKFVFGLKYIVVMVLLGYVGGGLI